VSGYPRRLIEVDLPIKRICEHMQQEKGIHHEHISTLRIWLYVVFNCASTPEVHVIQDPVRLGWEPLVKIEHYHVGAKQILAAGET